LVLHVIALYCRVLHDIAGYYSTLHGIALYCRELHGITGHNTQGIAFWPPSCLLL